MIFSVNPAYRNCPSCGKKVAYSPLSCPQCHTAFPAENTRQIEAIVGKCRERTLDERVRFSKFYEYHAGEYHHIYVLPLHTLEELLVVENLLFASVEGEEAREFWYASYEPFRENDGMNVQCLSWQRCIWDAERELFVAGPDEGPRTIVFTSWE